VALGRAPVERFHLMKSDLTPRGPLYTVMTTFGLGKEHPLG
jgi:2'-5' RNA ligase